MSKRPKRANPSKILRNIVYKQTESKKMSNFRVIFMTEDLYKKRGNAYLDKKVIDPWFKVIGYLEVTTTQRTSGE